MCSSCWFEHSNDGRPGKAERRPSHAAALATLAGSNDELSPGISGTSFTCSKTTTLPCHAVC